MEVTNIKDVKLPVSKPTLKYERTVPGPPKRGRFLIWGPPGAGKTTVAGTFPKPLFIDFFGGIEAVRHKKIAYIRPKKYVNTLLATLPLNLQEFETVVIDHATGMGVMFMDEALKEAGRDLPVQKDWQYVIERMRRIIRALTRDDALPDKHIVVTAEQALIHAEATGEIIYKPAVPGKLRDELATYFDCALHLKMRYNPDTKQKGRFLLSVPEQYIDDAKDRLGGLAKLEVPDFKVLWQKLTEHQIEY